MFCPICGAKLRFEESGVCCDQCKAKETKPVPDSPTSDPHFDSDPDDVGD